MARPVLPTDFKDDVLAESMSGKRRYRIIQNADGTVSLDDVTDYEQVGSVFGAKQVNDMSSAVNSIEDVKAANNCTTTEPGFVLDARQGKTLMDKSNELSRDLGRVNVYVGSDGKLHFVNSGGADSALPFSVEPYINTKYIIATRQTYSISIGRPANCISIYNRHLKGTSYAGFSMAIKNGSKLTMVGSDPNGSIGSKIENWDVTFTNTGVIFKAPSTILYNSIECEVFVC